MGSILYDENFFNKFSPKHPFRSIFKAFGILIFGDILLMSILSKDFIFSLELLILSFIRESPKELLVLCNILISPAFLLY